LLIGPVFTREVAIAPRRTRLYVARTTYAGTLLILMATAWLLLTGMQLVRDTGDLARFGMGLIEILARLQLALALFFSAMLSASAVAQEKDRRTLVLLLLTNLSNCELVLGKLMASLLNVLVLAAAALPIFMLSALFGGVSFEQIARVFAVTLVSAMACGSLGSTLALWREKTFQSLAMTVLALVLWLAVWEMVAAGALGGTWLGFSCQQWATALSPWEAIQEATRPCVREEFSGVMGLVDVFSGVGMFLLAGSLVSVALNGIAVALVRRWNPSREARQAAREDETWNRESIWGAEYDAAQRAREGQPEVSSPAADTREKVSGKKAARTRHVWDNPILWREIRTWAYGRKMLFIRLGYLMLFGLVAASLAWGTTGLALSAEASIALTLLFVLSLVLVNAQAVTSLTSERDGKAMDLLLVSDLTPKEFVFGKLGGVFYNTKEMIALPLGLCLWLWYAEVLTLENLIYLVLSLAVLYVFVAMVGIHTGMHYENSRSAIGTSLGTVFFLFVGVAVCMRMMAAFSGSFEGQLPAFLAFMVGGSAGLYVALGARNPSAAIGLAAMLCPVVTFYAITSFFIDQTHLAFVAVAGAYGFTTVAMLIPAIDEFDVATGRTTIGEQ
jgi:ABC-type transport system involved in multi-copper enzyme maturation permease subunit